MSTTFQAVTKNRPQDRLFKVLRDVMSSPSGAIGLSLVVFHLVLAVISPFIVPFDYREISSLLMLQGPSFEHWFGNDHLGWDIFHALCLVDERQSSLLVLSPR
jgi:peptide/nickel transport system permease protein